MTPVFKLEIECGNAAFGDSFHERGQELARLLRQMADKLEANGAPHHNADPWPLYDLNGNRVGQGKASRRR